jgi:hypothetical protein
VPALAEKLTRDRLTAAAQSEGLVANEVIQAADVVATIGRSTGIVEIPEGLVTSTRESATLWRLRSTRSGGSVTTSASASARCSTS